MGTSGAYSGSGDTAGKRLRRELKQWLDDVPLNDDRTEPRDDSDNPQDEPPADTSPPQGHLSPDTLLNVIPLLRPRTGGGQGGDGPGVGGGLGPGGARGPGTGTRNRGGAHRTAAGFATTAGRAAAAAYAYQTGDATALARLGLDYAELRALGDPLEVTVRIVNAACGPLSDSTIEHEEQRYVAGEIAQWVIEQGEAGATPTPEEIVRKTIALIIQEAALSEAGELARQADRPENTGELTEREIEEVAEALAGRAELSVNGPTEDEITQAVEDGIETLRRMRGHGRR
ncbi:MAG: hypothetical protein M0Z82_05235 [Actinomycetota bacterium]|jgi:hypothetical protein|nr:hypothetical protein [Actinomycetota bacterium]